VDANLKPKKIMGLSAMLGPARWPAGPEVQAVDYEQGLLAVTDLGIPSLSAA
jgi:aminoglycoside/choline kinase family phosphotransferase